MRRVVLAGQRTEALSHPGALLEFTVHFDDTRGAVMIDRRTFLTLAGVMAMSSVRSEGQGPQGSPIVPRDWSGATPLPYPDPDIVALDQRFSRYIIRNTPIRRLHTGTLWAEGPAWNGVGRYLVWSDIPNNVQLRWLDENGLVTRRSATRPGTATATRSTTRAVSWRASMAAAGSSRYEPDGQVR